MSNAALVLGEEVYEIDTLHLIKLYDKQTGSSLSLKSDIADAMLSGDFQLTNIVDNSLDLINHFYTFSDSIPLDTNSN